jgi:hypothetical protein
MIDQCIQFMNQSPTGEQCVAILVTDGVPTLCDVNQQNLINIVANGQTQGVLTFTLGLRGADINALNLLAQAGGTTSAIDIAGGSAAFIAALNAIRDKVTTTETTQVTTTEVISTTLDCQWLIPEPPEGQRFDPAKVNLLFTPMGAGGEPFGYVPTEADCGGADNTWYFDDPHAPTQIFVCPGACEKVKNAPGARVDVQLGCDRIEGPPM